MPYVVGFTPVVQSWWKAVAKKKMKGMNLRREKEIKKQQIFERPHNRTNSDLYPQTTWE